MEKLNLDYLTKTDEFMAYEDLCKTHKERMSVVDDIAHKLIRATYKDTEVTIVFKDNKIMRNCKIAYVDFEAWENKETYTDANGVKKFIEPRFLTEDCCEELYVEDVVWVEVKK